MQQAFTRRSYSNENGGNNNEVLEFIGDKVLDFAVVYFLSNHFGKISNNGYDSKRDEGYLTELKSALVSTNSLATVADVFHLTQYLILGKSDINNKRTPKSVKEDLVEAIIGAIALDSKWNLIQTFDVVNHLLDIDMILGKESGPTNYVGELQNYLAKQGVDEPVYAYQGQGNLWTCFGSVKAYRAEMFGIGSTKKEARQAVAKELLDYVKKCDYNEKQNNEFYDVIGEPDENNALQQINQLVQLGLISKPRYDFYCEYDEDGNPIWTCECRIKEITKYFFHNTEKNSNSKKTAQRSAAFGLLEYLVGNDEDDDDEEEA